MANMLPSKSFALSLCCSPECLALGPNLIPDLPAPAPQTGGNCLQCEGCAAKNEQFRLQASRCHRAVHLSN